MTRQKQISMIRRLMVQRVENIKAAMDSAAKSLKHADDRSADYFDLAAIEASKSVDLMCRTLDRRTLIEAKETIMRIDSGLYGICDMCGRQISQKRLLAAPMSKLCVKCQEHREMPIKNSRNRAA